MTARIYHAIYTTLFRIDRAHDCHRHGIEANDDGAGE